MGRHLNGYAERGQNIDHPLSWEPDADIDESEQAVDLWSLPENAATADIEGLFEGTAQASSADSLAAAWMGALARSSHATPDIDQTVDRANGRDVVDDADPYAAFRTPVDPGLSLDDDLSPDDDRDYVRYGTATPYDDAPYGEDAPYSNDTPYSDDTPYHNDSDDTHFGTDDHRSNGPAAEPADRRTFPGPRRAPRSGLLTMLLLVVANTVAGLVTLLLIGLVTPRADASDPGTSAPAAEVDDRVVVSGTSSGCATMLVKPQLDGISSQAYGTCFRVG